MYYLRKYTHRWSNHKETRENNTQFRTVVTFGDKGRGQDEQRVAGGYKGTRNVLFLHLDHRYI